MTSKWIMPTAVVAAFIVVGAGVELSREIPLVRDAHAMSRPQHTTALSVSLRSGGGKNTTPYAHVVFQTSTGRHAATLPRLEHSATDYLTPLELVYDESDPDRVLLASDWSSARNGTANRNTWIAGIAAAVALSYVVGVLLVTLRSRVAGRSGR